MKKTVIFLAVMFAAKLFAAGPSGREILERIDRNYRAKTRISQVTMIIRGARGTRTLTSKSWGEGTDKTFSVYLSPPRDKDTKMLKIGNELWIWTPSTDRIIKIAGQMLRQSMMGSDVSYEDFMEDPVLTNTYDVEVKGEEIFDGNSCYVLALTAKKEKTPAYFLRKLLVDRERYLPLKEELFAKSGKLLKEFRIEETFKAGDRWYPRKMTFKDALMKGEGTQIIIDSMEFDAAIPDYIFSKASLKK